MRLSSLTALSNASGNPAMSVPLGKSSNGLPIGTQFIGRFGDEALLFRLASQLENIKPWNTLYN
jgi:Asp-tRNA(Asn)/Glu-tRNA(Gln) amidotransferase A subunit family amidase